MARSSNLDVVRFLSEYKRLIADRDMISQAIFDYNEGDFLQMRNIINEYGAHTFFEQLYAFLDEHTWRSSLNKHLLFVGITITYHSFPNDEPRLNKKIKGDSIKEEHLQSE